MGISLQASSLRGSSNKATLGTPHTYLSGTPMGNGVGEWGMLPHASASTNTTGVVPK